MTRWLKLIGFAGLMCFVAAFVWLICLLDAMFRFRFSFPRDIDALRDQQAWCEEQLRAAGALPGDARLLSYEVVPFKEKESLRSELAVVEIAYQQPEDADDVSPRRFRCLAKCAPQQGSLWNRTIYVLQGNCTKEVGFYQDLADTVPGLVPRCYFAGVSEGTGHFCLLLELLDEVKEYSEEEGCPQDVAADVMASLARFHGAFWGRFSRTHKWLSAIPDVFVDLFLVAFGGKLDAAYGHRSREIWRRCNAPQTVLHGDARVGNMLFREVTDEASGASPVVLFDWQATRLGLGVCDVAYFLVLSVETEVRLAHEERLLRVYHEGLLEAGVTEYDWVALREDYRHACLLLGQMFGLPFLSSEISVDDEESKRRALSGGLTWSRRGHAFIKQLDGAWLKQAYGIDREVLLEHTEASLLAPHPMNHGAELVASYLREHGGVKALYGSPRLRGQRGQSE